MEELVLQPDKPGLFSGIGRMFTRERVSDEAEQVASPREITLKANYRYTVTVRRQISSFDDAMAAAMGLKRGEQQILNLSMTDPMVRQKVVDFMCGVNFAQEGTWEEVGEHIYLVVPANAYVEVAPATPRIQAARN